MAFGGDWKTMDPNRATEIGEEPTATDSEKN